MGHLLLWIEAYVVVAGPVVRLAGECVVGVEGVGAVEAEGRQVEGDGGLADAVRVEAEDDQDPVVAVLGHGTLGEGDHRVVVRPVEAQVAQLVQGRVGAAQFVQGAQERGQ